MKRLNRVMAFNVVAVLGTALAIPQSGSAQEAAAPAQAATPQPPGAQPAAAPADPAAAPQPPADQQAAPAGEPPVQPAAEPPAPRKLEILELQHREPQQLSQLLGLWDQVAVPGYGGRGRIAVQRPSLEEPPSQRVAIALDNEKKLIFVRGTAEQIEKVKALVAALDVADDAVKPQDFANYRLIPVPNDTSGQIQSTLTQLDLAGQSLRVGNTTFIAYPTDDEDRERLQQAEQVISRLTAQPPAETPPAAEQPAAAEPAPSQPAAAQPAAPQPAATQPAPAGT